MLHPTPIASGETFAASIPGLDVLRAETLGDPAICVAMLDGPVDLSHPCFEGALLMPLETLASGVADEGPATAHGTHVASVIFGQPGCEIQGIAPGCRGLILPVFESRDGSVAPCSQIDLARAITQAVDYGAHVINISGGELSPSDEPHPLLANAIGLCADNKVLIVAAAGNDGCQCLHVPAAVSSVLGVGAMDEQGEPLDFSNWGTVYQAQGILAPGKRVVGAAPGGGMAAYSGTSFATPIVSGVIALLLSLQRRRGERPNPHMVRRVILSSAVGCDEQPVAECRRLLAGRLNLVGTLNHLTQGGPIAMSTKHKKGKKEEAEQPAGTTVASPEPSPGLRAAESAPLVAAPPAAYSPAWMPYTPSFVAPSSCGCGGGQTCTCGAGTQLVYALGQVHYDFGTEARHDSFLQEFKRHNSRFGLEGDNALTEPSSELDMLKYLGDGTDDEVSGRRPTHASALIWTLVQDTTPIYAIQPGGAFARETYYWLRKFLRFHHPETGEQQEDYAERVSIPGILHGKVTLLNGMVVPVIIPDQRGMWAWTMGALITHALGERPAKETAKQKKQRDEKEETLKAILERIYYEIRNLGVTPQERALNYAATDAFQLTETFEGGMALDTIEVEKSPICRPGSDCWDVKLTFFNPNKIEAARHVYRFTIDVSDVIPMTVGTMRHWAVR